MTDENSGSGRQSNFTDWERSLHSVSTASLEATVTQGTDEIKRVKAYLEGVKARVRIAQNELDRRTGDAPSAPLFNLDTMDVEGMTMTIHP